MNKKGKLLSLVTALAITASAFTGLVIPASAEGTSAAVNYSEWMFDSTVTTDALGAAVEGGKEGQTASADTVLNNDTLQTKSSGLTTSPKLNTISSANGKYYNAASATIAEAFSAPHKDIAAKTKVYALKSSNNTGVYLKLTDVLPQDCGYDSYDVIIGFVYNGTETSTKSEKITAYQYDSANSTAGTQIGETIEVNAEDLPLNTAVPAYVTLSELKESDICISTYNAQILITSVTVDYNIDSVEEDETPTPDETETPTPDETETPTPDETNAPVTDETPTPDETNAPVTDETPTPDETNAPVTDETPTPEETNTPVTEPTEKPAAVNKNNSIDISESFDSDPVNGEGYTWDVETVADWGGANKGFSLTANAGKDILTIADGAGGNQKDIKISFDAGTIKGFGQDAATWALVFKSTDGTELFKFRFVSGGWARTLSLVVGDEVQNASYNSYTDSAYISSTAYISFGPNGGTVTLGDISAKFDEGVDLGSVSVEYDNVKDWDRPFIIDNFKLQTVDKEKVTFNITSTEEGQSVEGAVLTIGDDVYTVPADGKLEAYYLTGTYTYDLKLAKHKAVSGDLNVEIPGTQQITITTTTTTTVSSFTDIDSAVTKAALIKIYYDENDILSKIETEDVDIADGKYVVDTTVSETTSTDITLLSEGEEEEKPDKYLLWDSLAGMKPVGTWTVDTSSESSDSSTTRVITNEIGIELEYVGDPVPTKIEISGGEEYIYLQSDENTTSEAFTATVYDQSDLVMDTAEVEWTLPGQPDTISIGSDGVVTLTPDYVLTDDNGVDVVIRATVKGTEVSADTSIHIHNIARAKSWDVVGPAVIKDGTTATYTVENVKDQYGNPYTGEETYTLTSTDAKAEIDGLSITPNVGTSRTDDVTLTVTLDSDSSTKVERTVTVYGYDFYEPGINELSVSSTNARCETVNNAVSLVWPKSATANSSTVITLPNPVNLEAGSAKMITFDNVWTTQTVGSQERSLTFYNSESTSVISIDFAGSSVVKDWSKVDGNYTGTEIGKLNSAGETSSAIFVLKTDANGVTSAILSYNGSTLAEYEIGAVGDIASIKLGGGSGAPDERLLTLTNIIISDSDVAEVEIVGDDQIAKISGLTATKKFKGSIFSQSEGETFTWSVADADGNAINGVSIDQNGVLSVTDAVPADTVAVISYTSSLSTEDAPKLATHEVTIKDFAAVASFDIDGPVAVNAGETVTYSAANVVDEYGDTVTMPVSFAITEGNDIASIDASTGVVTTTGALGNYTVSVTVGNPEKTMTKQVEVEVAKYSAVGDVSGNSVVVDVTELANYAADTQYLVTTATADGVLVKQTETAATDGKVTVDTTGAAKYEVSPIYSFDNVGNIASGKEISICDGRYEFTFVKSNMTRGDIYVNGIMVGNNIDQDGKGTSPAASSPAWTVDDVLVQGGKAVVTMKDNTSEMDSITIKKNPSILERKTHLYILGDSLVADYHKSFDYSTGDTPAAGDAQTGWGQVLNQFVSDELNVTNLAESGNYAEGLYSPAFVSALASAETGDYIIIECGYNDKNYSSASKMKDALAKMAEECAAKGVTIIMSGPNFGPLRGDTNSGSAVFTSDVLAAAQEAGVLGINLSAAGKAYYEAQGWTSDYWGQNFNCYYSGAVQDNLHLSYHGAMLQASLIAQAISDAQNDTENAELAASLAGLKLDKTAKTLTDSTGATITLQVK